MEGGPVPGTVSFPRGKAVIDGHGIGNPQFLTCRLHLIQRSLPRKFRRVDTDNYQALRLKAFMPIRQLRDRMYAVNSAVGPKLHEDDLATKIGDPKGWRIDPDLIADLWGTLAD